MRLMKNMHAVCWNETPPRNLWPSQAPKPQSATFSDMYPPAPQHSRQTTQSAFRPSSAASAGSRLRASTAEMKKTLCAATGPLAQAASAKADSGRHATPAKRLPSEASQASCQIRLGSCIALPHTMSEMPKTAHEIPNHSNARVSKPALRPRRVRVSSCASSRRRDVRPAGVGAGGEEGLHGLGRVAVEQRPGAEDEVHAREDLESGRSILDLGEHPTRSTFR